MNTFTELKKENEKLKAEIRLLQEKSNLPDDAKMRLIQNPSAPISSGKLKLFSDRYGLFCQTLFVSSINGI